MQCDKTVQVQLNEKSLGLCKQSVLARGAVCLCSTLLLRDKIKMPQRHHAELSKPDFNLFLGLLRGEEGERSTVSTNDNHRK